MAEEVTSFVVECFWPGVDDAAVRIAGARAARSADELTRGGTPVRYLGSLLLWEDEVVLYQFEGTADAVRVAAERAHVPFERILETTRSSRPATETT